MPFRSASPVAEHVSRVLTAVDDARMAATSAVAASWARSVRLHRLSPEAGARTRQCEDTELGQRRERAGRLLHVAQETMDRVHLVVGSAGCGLVLCDQEGLVLDSRLAKGLASDFDGAGLRPGVDWSERAMGTNGIGTCIAEGRSVAIVNDQHFLACNTEMSCFGAPIFDSSGRLRGVLDASTLRAAMDPGLRAMLVHAVCSAAVQIEADLFTDAHGGHRIIQVGTRSAGRPALLAVDADDLVIGATQAARRRLGLSPTGDIVPIPASDLLGDARARGTGFESAERRELRRALARSEGNMTAAAKALGVSRATLYRRAAKLDLLPTERADGA